MDQLIEFGLFFGKVIVVVIGLLAIISFIAGQALRAQHQSAQLEIDRLDKKFDDYARLLNAELLNKKEAKKLAKQIKKQEKTKKEKSKKLYVIDFDGDIKASAVKHLRDEVSLVLTVATPQDEVIVRVNSPGGMVHTYGLAAAQLDRVKKAGVPLTVAVDKVAASGGYMMACTGNKIIASPFAILGSIGVLAQVPNLHRFLKDKKVDYEEITAGDYKRTISMLGEITEKGRQKFTEQIEDTHKLFKEFVKMHRPQVDIDKVGTGEYWFGLRAKELMLVDDILTSDEYFTRYKDDAEIIKISLCDRKKIGEKIAENFGKAAENVLERSLQLFQPGWRG